MENTVFIQTNHKQIVGALIAEYAFRRNSLHTDKFDIRIVNVNDIPTSPRTKAGRCRAPTFWRAYGERMRMP